MATIGNTTHTKTPAMSSAGEPISIDLAYYEY